VQYSIKTSYVGHRSCNLGSHRFWLARCKKSYWY